ncbi:MAG: hypothetical protein A2Z01_00225 [Betaproteobacteria bacterium RBG_16_58_11]|nr:MAG: hypothetical protein A2Z01_00225 [Betaproteobacteria bacterium RBG_16_58_11]
MYTNALYRIQCFNQSKIFRSTYRAALKEIDSLMRARPKTAEGNRFDMLVTLVEAYERAQAFPLEFDRSGQGDQILHGAVM